MFYKDEPHKEHVCNHGEMGAVMNFLSLICVLQNINTASMLVFHLSTCVGNIRQINCDSSSYIFLCVFVSICFVKYKKKKLNQRKLSIF